MKYFQSHFAESNWFGDSGAEFDLNPPTLVSESTFTGNRMGPCGIQVTTWNWKSFSGSVTWGREAAEGDLLPGEHPKIATDEMWRNTRCLEFDYDPIPDVRIDGAFIGDGWKATALGDCALDVDGSKDHGFVTVGKPASRDDARFRAVLSGWTLFVEVRDDVFIGPSARWVNDDHLEIWLGSEADDTWKGGLLGEAASEKVYEQQFPVQQWGIRMVDASVFPAAGNPTGPLTAERFQVDPNTVHLRLKLPSPFKTITVVYSDSDDARGQKTLLATSRLIFNVGSSLGVARTIDPARAKCAVINGRLEPVLAPTPGPECPLVGGESP
jgi:hypothetical protein